MAARSGSHEKEAAYFADVPISDDSSEGGAQDDKDMARMGKKQEFKRNFGWISSVGFTSCTMDKSITSSLRIFDADQSGYAPDTSPNSFPRLL